MKAYLSFAANYRADDNKPLVGGVFAGCTSRFQSKRDAETRLQTILELNGSHCSGEVRPQQKYPEIFIHCGNGPARAIGGHCFECRKLLTIADAKLTNPIG